MSHFLMGFPAAFSVILLVACSLRITLAAQGLKMFPRNFKFGVATAAYQIEGGWNASDKGESIWDRMTHVHTDKIFDHSNGDTSADSYHRFKEDIGLLRVLGVDFYRFSIAWTRVLPTGMDNHVSTDGVRYYNKLINELLRHNIKPVVTMYHWDLPQCLEDLGGWTNPIVAGYFSDYAKVLFDNFGDRVKDWITFNEPNNVCIRGYDQDRYAPALNMHGIGGYLCAHTVLNAHGLVYRLYDNNYRKTQGGKIGITLNGDWTEPNTEITDDKEAAERAMQFTFGLFAHPIFSKTGNYPPVMRKIIDSKSKAQGLSQSRLPVFSDEELTLIRGSADFLGLNHYTTVMVSSENIPQYVVPSFADDMNVWTYQKSSWPGSNSTWLKVVPWGFRKVLNWIKQEYDNPEVLVTENGISLEPGLSDPRRIKYIYVYLRSLLEAVTEDGCNVVGYAHWSLLDNFEWERGFSERFGLFEVDYTSPKLKRSPRNSAAYFRYVIKSRMLPTVTTPLLGYDDAQPMVDII